MFTRNTLYGLVIGLLVTIALLAGISVKPETSTAGEPATFSSYTELVSYIEKSTEQARQFGIWYGRDIMPGGMPEVKALSGARMMKSEAAAQDTGANTAPPDYSSTNNQVQGVDEADLVKTDGRYLYITGDRKLSIIRAYPPAEAKKTAEIKFSGQPVEAFINGDTLVVFGNGPEPDRMFVHQYNVTDRKKPQLIQDTTCDGYYITSRMIDNYVYAVVNTPVNSYEPAKAEKEKVVLPKITTNGKVRVIPPGEIHYFNYPDYAYRYTTILAIDTKGTTSLQSKTFLTGTSQHIFASAENLYLTGIKTPDYALYTEKLLNGLAETVPDHVAAQIKTVQSSGQNYSEKLQQVEEILDRYLNSLDYEKAPALEEKIGEYRDKWQRDMARERNKTVIHKLAVKNDGVEYLCRGEVGGHVLNQFSMDEHNGYFRIATTSEGFLFTDLPATRNNLYVLDENLQVTGSVLGLAPTERIYSARFMGDRAYLVTFRRIDPLFVIDLQDPHNPKVLGKLKIPGYSDYLHPYDENHLIGIGREVSVAPAPDSPSAQPRIIPPPAREQGIKIALFDVSNPAAPKEVAKYVVDRAGSDSPALRDHRAVLFSREKNLLAIPVSYGSLYRIMIEPESLPEKTRWQGVFVFTISPEKGIKLKGKVEHPGSPPAGRYYNYNAVKRSLYIGDVLYTVSEQQVKMNDLENLRELKTINLQ